jgi:hypothetical protein
MGLANPPFLVLFPVASQPFSVFRALMFRPFVVHVSNQHCPEDQQECQGFEHDAVMAKNYLFLLVSRPPIRHHHRR